MKKILVVISVLLQMAIRAEAVCGIPWSGDWTNSGTCTIPAGTIDGVDNGNAYLPAGTSLVVNGTFIYSPGTGSVRPTFPGQVTFGSGGKMMRTLAWYTDADGDSYASITGPIYLQNTSPGGAVVQKKNVLGYDCDDTNSAIHGGTPFVAYLDNDHDGFGAGPAVTLCSGSCASLPVGYSCNNTDCCDTDARAFPGQTAFFSDQRIGCGGYDFDCNGTVTKNQADYQTGWDCQIVSPASCVVPCSYVVGQDNGPTGTTQSPDCGLTYTAYLGCEYKVSYCECPAGSGGVVGNDYGPKTSTQTTMCH